VERGDLAKTAPLGAELLGDVEVGGSLIESLLG
jgi:hypothetical protein